MALKIRRSVHENTEPEIIYFESDDEFEDWAVAPYATIVELESGKTWQGDHPVIDKVLGLRCTSFGYGGVDTEGSIDAEAKPIGSCWDSWE